MEKGLEIFSKILDNQMEGTKIIISRICKPKGDTDYALKQRSALYHKMWGVVMCLYTQNLLTDTEAYECMVLVNEASNTVYMEGMGNEPVKFQNR